MKDLFDSNRLPANSLFITCSSHEDRCLGIPRGFGAWRPAKTLLFHYHDPNPRREENHQVLNGIVAARSPAIEIPFVESNAVDSFRQQHDALISTLQTDRSIPIVADISVLTKRHLLLLLRWIDDYDGWNRLWIVYSEPEEYEIEGHMPLSFGVSQVEQVPGFPAAPDPSRPLHVAMLLGYEGDRAFATFELLQPKQTTLIIPHPAFKPSWEGRTESQNHNLLEVVGTASLHKSDSIDPESTFAVLSATLGNVSARSEFAKALCPLGTKPQTVGLYMYLRECLDPPAVIYSGALRHNHSYYSRGVGKKWLIHRPR